MLAAEIGTATANCCWLPGHQIRACAILGAGAHQRTHIFALTQLSLACLWPLESDQRLACIPPRQQDLRRKLGNRKLLLVLDLDHTLLNSSRAAEISSELREQLQSQLESQVRGSQGLSHPDAHRTTQIKRLQAPTSSVAAVVERSERERERVMAMSIQSKSAQLRYSLLLLVLLFACCFAA